MEQKDLKILFEKIGQDLNIQANLITCEEFSRQSSLGWAQRLKGVNWIYIDLTRTTEDFNRFKDCGGIFFSCITAWRPASNINIALAYLMIHEFTHLQQTPQSRIGLTVEDYFIMLEQLGTRGDIIRLNTMETNEDQERQVEQHDDHFFNMLRLNVYRCWKTIAEYECKLE